jgi:hypothetical protein
VRELIGGKLVGKTGGDAVRKIIILGAASIAIAVFAYVGFNAWLAWGLPARPVSDYSTTRGCEAHAQYGNFYIDSPHQCRARQQEAALFKTVPGLATRDGDNLTIFYRGKQTTRLMPVARQNGKCDAVEVHKALALFDPASGQQESVPLISCHYGEFEERFVAMPDGSRWVVKDATASPDGKMIATGANSMFEPSELSGLTLWSWPSRQPITHFTPNCRVIEWTQATRLTVTCFPYDKGISETPFDARVWRDTEGMWQMQATRWLNGPLGFSDTDDMEIAPGFSLRPLPRFTGTAGK